MEKIIKVFKVCLYALLFACLITFIVCLFVIPNETKDFVEKTKDFVNQPLPIVGVSILTGGFILWKIIDCTPIGKKGYNAIKDDFEKEKAKVIAYKEIVSDKVKELETTKNECLAILNGYSEQIDNLTENVVKVCETSPNAKIKALGEEIKAQSSNIKVEIANKQEQAKNGLAQELETKDNKFNELQKELDELKALVLSVKEKSYGREEEKDN